jgi:hypothetical protein
MDLKKRQEIVAEVRRRVLEELFQYDPACDLKIGDAKFLSNRVGTILFELLPAGK